MNENKRNNEEKKDDTMNPIKRKSDSIVYLVIQNNFKELKGMQKKKSVKKGKRNLKTDKLQDVTPLFAAIRCGLHSKVELLLNLQPLNFDKEVGKDPPDLYSMKFALETTEEQLNQKIEELQLNGAACTFLGDKEVCYLGRVGVLP